MNPIDLKIGEAAKVRLGDIVDAVETVTDKGTAARMLKAAVAVGDALDEGASNEDALGRITRLEAHTPGCSS